MIESLLALSVVINLIFILYSRWLISILKTSEQDLNSVSEMMQSYVTHIESVHEMEMFYGDQTLQKLIEHGGEIISEINEFDFILSSPEEYKEMETEENVKSRK